MNNVITMRQLQECIRELPPAENIQARTDTFNVAVRPEWPVTYTHPYDTLSCPVVRFRRRRIRVEGAYAWGWFYNEILVRVDV